MSFNRKEHWENIYLTKKPEEVSWYQKSPSLSLKFIEKSQLYKSSSIIDIGGGDSLLADHLLRLGYQNITVLDISKKSIERAKKRLGKDAKSVRWIVSDIIQFVPDTEYDLWHDRAAFHFLSTENEINKYIDIAYRSLKEEGIAVIGTFSLKGPLKCSGIEVMRYSEQSMADRLHPRFKKIECLSVDHITPAESRQNFTYCRFKKS